MRLAMKNCVQILALFAAVLSIGLVTGSAAAKDYPVTFLKETYKAQETAGGAPKIYHTWAVESDKGNRLLILVGDD